MFIFVVPEGTCCILEIFGKPSSVRKGGLHFRVPFLQNIRRVPDSWGEQTNRQGVFIELTEQTLDTRARRYITQDNVNVSADCVIRWRIQDPIKAVYSVDRLHMSIVETVLNELRTIIGSMKLDDVLSQRASIADKVAVNISATLSRWGVMLTTAEIQELKTDDATAEAMRQIMEAERRSRALATEAEGESAAIVKRAEAARQAAVLQAEGEAEAVRIAARAEQEYLSALAGIIGREEAARVLMNRQMLQCYGSAAKEPGAKVFMPVGLPSVVDPSKS